MGAEFHRKFCPHPFPFISVSCFQATFHKSGSAVTESSREESKSQETSTARPPPAPSPGRGSLRYRAQVRERRLGSQDRCWDPPFVQIQIQNMWGPANMYGHLVQKLLRISRR